MVATSPDNSARREPTPKERHLGDHLTTHRLFREDGSSYCHPGWVDPPEMSGIDYEPPAPTVCPNCTDGPPMVVTGVSVVGGRYSLIWHLACTSDNESCQTFIEYPASDYGQDA